MILGMEDIPSNFSSIDYDEVTIDFFNVLNGVAFTLTKRNAGMIPMYVISHQDPFRICYTRKYPYERNLVLDHDNLLLNPRKLAALDIQTQLEVYVHQEGQLLRHLSQPAFSLHNWDLIPLLDAYEGGRYGGFSYEIKFRVTGVEVLRKRSNGATPCNLSLIDEDAKWRNIIIDTLGCVPVFWKRFVSNSSVHQILPDCNKVQYKKLYLEYLTTDEGYNYNFENAASRYINPCTQMGTAVTITTKTNNFILDQINMYLIYATEEYKETVNNKAYNFETLCSQVGGFIGR